MVESVDVTHYVGTLVGESTSREFRLAVTHDAVREQDLIAVDATVRRTNEPDATQQLRIWAKVARIERINPLFPVEAGHELAATRTSAHDTVLSLSREMVTAVCQILGSEAIGSESGGRLDQLRYPAKPATVAYSPDTDDVKRIILGDLKSKRDRALDVATLSNRPDVEVSIDGHAIVTRHLAILAMTGAGKSWTSRRILEELAKKNYPIVVFDPHGDYTGLAEVPHLSGKVRRYHAQFPIFEQDAETVATVVESLGWKLAKTHRERFDSLFEAARHVIGSDPMEVGECAQWLASYLNNPRISHYGVKPNLFFLADFVQAVVLASKQEDLDAIQRLTAWGGDRDDLKLTKQQAGWLEGLPNNLRRAAKRLHQMEEISRRVAGESEPLPNDRTELVQYGQVTVVALAGYQSDFQATIYSLVADAIFSARVAGTLPYPVLLVLEEAHNFAPAKTTTEADIQAVATTRQIAQEGRKFGVGLIVISQRPSRLDETTLSQCNSYVIMRLSNPADQNYVRRVIETLGEEDTRLLPDLDVGEALLSGQLINFPVLVRIKPPESKGEREEEDAFSALAQAHNRQQRQR